MYALDMSANNNDRPKKAKAFMMQKQMFPNPNVPTARNHVRILPSVACFLHRTSPIEENLLCKVEDAFITSRLTIQQANQVAK